MTEPFVGKELGARTLTVTDRLLADYYNGLVATRRADGKFTNPAWPGDAIAAHGVATGGVDGDADRGGTFVWRSKADDTRVPAVEASVAA